MSYSMLMFLIHSIKLTILWIKLLVPNYVHFRIGTNFINIKMFLGIKLHPPGQKCLHLILFINKELLRSWLMHLYVSCSIYPFIEPGKLVQFHKLSQCLVVKLTFGQYSNYCFSQPRTARMSDVIASGFKCLVHH